MNLHSGTLHRIIRWDPARVKGTDLSFSVDFETNNEVFKASLVPDLRQNGPNLAPFIQPNTVIVFSFK